jgi:hypothetical protein
MRNGRAVIATAGTGGFTILDVSDPDTPEEILRTEEFARIHDLRITDDGSIYAAASMGIGSFYTAGQILEVAGEGPGWSHISPKPLHAPLGSDGTRLLAAEEYGVGVYEPARGTGKTWATLIDGQAVASSTSRWIDRGPCAP